MLLGDQAIERLQDADEKAPLEKISLKEDSQVVYTQNYYILCNDLEHSFHEILEYQVKKWPADA